MSAVDLIAELQKQLGCSTPDEILARVQILIQTARAADNFKKAWGALITATGGNK